MRGVGLKPFCVSMPTQCRSGPRARSAHCDGPQQLPPCWYRYPYRCVRVMGEWCPPGVIIWSLICFQAYVRRGCGIQRTPGDKVTVEKNQPGCAFIEGGVIQGVVLFSMLYGTLARRHTAMSTDAHLSTRHIEFRSIMGVLIVYTLVLRVYSQYE